MQRVTESVHCESSPGCLRYKKCEKVRKSAAGQYCAGTVSQGFRKTVRSGNGCRKNAEFGGVCWKEATFAPSMRLRLFFAQLQTIGHNYRHFRGAAPKSVAESKRIEKMK
jgi:hypothetical protein